LYGANDGQIGPEQLNAVRLSGGLPLGCKRFKHTAERHIQIIYRPQWCVQKTSRGTYLENFEMPTSLTLRRVRPVTPSAQDVARHAFSFQFARRQRVGRGVVLDRTIVHALIAALEARTALAHLVVESEARASQTPRMAFSAHGFAGQSAQRGAPLLQRTDPFVIITVRTSFVLV